ncbi:MAG: methylenetetrahydrofolate--tRNA-(uracil(54)-C(5))-methyltransferase (FADH(2)-oxidizing) TrmFO [Proteobacteria bacterium]|nr:methylenetetrahydrofolate--tRNA-(uracil(54)-C(5))-methyltransferase (FADH(2)-oxidizing) TrmFO [Pseudomonadota bacterium]
MDKTVHIIGGGLAGSEAAWQLATRGISVVLYEMRGPHTTSVHKTDKLAELVCSNSFRGGDVTKNAVGVLHTELRKLGSLIMQSADSHKVPAGGALAVDREPFSETITNALEAHPNITIVREQISELPDHPYTLIATGPLTSDGLAAAIRQATGEEGLAFFDAVAPIVTRESINMDVAWEQSRYDKGDKTDYINCPMTQEQYMTFITAAQNAEQSVGHNPEDANVPYFEGCLPIEVMIDRGPETLRFGPLKPVGLTNPRNPTVKPYAIVQLRRDNKLGTLYNMVGFQTRMKWGAQKEVLKLIPGLENAEIVRYGVIHKNTFIHSPKVLDANLRLKAKPNIRFAGQVTGVEGYVESTAMGALAGLLLAAEILETPMDMPPATTMLGALHSHITGGAEAETFQPMNINYGLLPPLTGKRVGKKDRKPAYGERAMADFDTWLQTSPLLSQPLAKTA